MVFKRIKIGAFERGLVFVDGQLVRVLQPGRHWETGVGRAVDVVDVRGPWLTHANLAVIARAGLLGDELEVIDLADEQRALVWVDGRLDAVLGPGLFALWTVFRRVRVELIDASVVRFEHRRLPVILEDVGARGLLQAVAVDPGHVGLWFLEGELKVTLEPGTHAFWKGVGKVDVRHVDKRESVLDVAGQELMTADKVTLRLNAVVTYRVTDPLKAATETEDFRQALYRDAQLALRAVIGTRTLDTLLEDKDEVASQLQKIVGDGAKGIGLKIEALGIRDVILPGEMKDLMNRVIEAKKAAEAALITRREETAAMRSQANTARLIEANPTLMRLRELEALERLTEKGSLTVVLGEQGLVDRVTKML